jgi:hypothetical protein
MHAMSQEYPYTTILDIKYDHLELIDVPAMVKAVKAKWYNVLIDLEDRTVTLDPWQGFTITRGILHRTRAPKKTVMLMVETSEILPTGD